METFQITEQDVLDFWFSFSSKEKWFNKDGVFDAEITLKFLDAYELAKSGKLEHWRKSPAGILALIIILDQFPRNMFRNSAKSFTADSLALSLAKHAIDVNMDESLSDDYKQFLYMPLMHSENLEDQRLCFKLSTYNLQMQVFAKKHMEIIERFGRFLHRNKTLGRESTDEEVEFLKLSHSGF